MSLDLTCFQRVRSVRLDPLLDLFSVLACLFLGVSSVGAPVSASTDTPTVLRLEDRSGELVASEWRQAVRSGLSQAAADEGVTLCDSGEDRPACAPEVLRNSPTLSWRISTAVTIKSALALVNLPVSLEVITESDLPLPEAGLFVIEEAFVLPTQKPAGGWTPWLAARVAGIVGHHPSISSWFAEIRTASGLESQLPEAALAPSGLPAGGEVAPRESAPPLPPAPEDTTPWRRQEEQILQMLIDNRFHEARRAADRLLDDENLPASERERVLHLRRTALEREAAIPATEAAKQAPPQGEAPQSPVPKPTETPFDYTFKVRVAQTGRGFLHGTDGRLRLFDRGISFVPTSQHQSPDEQAEGWFLRWSQIRRWGKAEGLWDISHPLEVRSSDRNIYFAVIDQKGRFSPGDRVLALLSQGARRSRGRHNTEE